jgi:hypothetical protein
MGDINVPIWDITKSQTMGFDAIRPKIEDYAIDIGRSSSLDEYGVLFALYTPAGFFSRFGVHPQPRPPMGPCTGKGAQIANWNALNIVTKQQEAALILLKSTLVKVIPAELLTPMEDDNGSLRNRTSEFIFSTLCNRLSTLTKIDIDNLHAQLKIAYSPSMPVEAFTSKFQSTLRSLAQAQQPVPNITAIDNLQECFGSEWAPCWVKFAQDNPILADRTVPLLSVAISAFARDALPILSAQAAIGISLIQDQTKMLQEQASIIASLQTQLSALQAQGTRKRPPEDLELPNTRSKAANWRKVPLKDRKFCWSCGPCGHMGSQCNFPKDGHQETATWKNQLQSKWKQLFQAKGWSIA